jgi:hypothetical protein
MRVLVGAAAALTLLGSAHAHAQAVYFMQPAPVYPAPVYVAPAPYYAPVVVAAPPAIVAPAYTGSVVVNARTGRSCTIEPGGYRWCWTP